MAEDGAPAIRVEDVTATLEPAVRMKAQALVRMLEVQGIFIKIISGRRTWAQQDKLYRQGRSDPGPIVTYARGGESWHNYGLAFDFAFRKNGNTTRLGALEEVGQCGEALGLEWGGRWKGRKKDAWHFQESRGRSIKQLRDAWLKELQEQRQRDRERDLDQEESEDDRPEDVVNLQPDRPRSIRKA